MGALSAFFLLLTITWAVESRRQLRMLGGKVIPDGSFPYVASVKHVKGGSLLKSCLGSVIDSQWVLSSALCLTSEDPKDIVVDLGVYVHSHEAPPIRHKVSKVVIHPAFNPKTAKNDFALVQLETPVSGITPVKLGQVQEGAKLVSIGWNEDVHDGLGHGKPEPYRLGRLDVAALDVKECQVKFPELHGLVDFDGSQVCTYSGPGKDLCGVDFGGPLIDEEKGVQVGVFSDVIHAASGHSHQCHSDHDHPLIFGIVESVKSWIGGVTNNSKL